jgi:hypothetical protein
MNKDKKLTDNDNGWTSEHETVLAEWGDKAMCYKWLHAKSNAKYRELNTWFTIPVIIMSTLTGTANFAQDKIPEDFRGYAPMIIGGVNILAGIITTIQQFLKIGELNEGHRVSSIVWDKFYRKIKVELSKHRDEREDAPMFIKSATEEYDRLMETSPMIDKNIVLLFYQTFEKSSNDKIREQFSKLKKPEICDSLISITESIHEMSEKEKRELLKRILNDIRETQGESQEPKENLIETFWELFKKDIKREPTQMELIDNLVNEELFITEQMIEHFLSKHPPTPCNVPTVTNYLFTKTPKNAPLKSTI